MSYRPFIKNGLRILMLLTFLGFVASLVTRSLHGTQITRENEESAQHYLVYTATQDRGPRFAIDSVAPMRIVSYLHLPEARAPGDYDPTARYEYALVFTVFDREGSAVDEHVVWVSTRKSKASFVDGRWEEQSARYTEANPQGEPADPRITDLDLASFAAPGQTMQINARAPDGAADVNLVAFQHFDRTPARIDWLAQTMNRVRKHEHALSAAINWGGLSEAELQKSLASGFRRMTALESQADRTLIRTDFRIETDSADPTGIDMLRVNSVAFNLAGPARLRLGARWPARLDAYPLTVDIVTSNEDGQRAVRRHESLRRRVEHPASQALDDENSVLIEIPAGQAAAVRVKAPRMPARLYTSLDESTAILGEHPATLNPDGTFSIAPDRRRIATWRVHTEPLRFVLDPAVQNRLHDAILIQLRSEHERTDSKIAYRFEGTEVAGSLPHDGLPSDFEEISTEDTVEPTTEPTTHRLWIPEGATALELDAAQSHWVTVSTLSTADLVETTHRAPYDEPPLSLRWRYAPLLEASWNPVFPDGDAHRGELITQTRLVPKMEDITPDVLTELANLGFDLPEPDRQTGQAITLEPGGRPTMARVIEVAQPSDEPRSRIKLDTRVPFSCETRDRRLSVILQAPEKALGQAYTITWNETSIRRRLIRTTFDQFTLRVPSNTGTLRLSHPGETDLDVWVDCQNRDVDHHVLRRVYLLGDSLSVDVKAPSEGTRYLNIVAYGQPRGSLDVEIGGAKPRRKSGSLESITIAARRVDWSGPVSAEVTRVGASPNTLAGPYVMSIPIGADLEPGRHRVTIRPTSKREGSNTWLRFFTYESP